MPRIMLGKLLLIISASFSPINVAYAISSMIHGQYGPMAFSAFASACGILSGVVLLRDRSRL